MAHANFAVVNPNLNDVPDLRVPDLRQVRSKTNKASRGFWRRVIEALVASRARQAERDIALYLTTRGFNDDFERDLERRFLSFPPYR
jgi:hypothetical protein